MLIETSPVYIIKMQIDTLQHTRSQRQFHLQWNRGGGCWDRWHTYRERKCHLLARPASQWSPSSSSEWRIPAAQRREPPHRWTCVTQRGHHMVLAGYTKCAMTHHRKRTSEPDIDERMKNSIFVLQKMRNYCWFYRLQLYFRRGLKKYLNCYHRRPFIGLNLLSVVQMSHIFIIPAALTCDSCCIFLLVI